MFNLACDFFAGKFQEPPFEHSGDLDPFYVDDHCEIFLQHLISTGCLVE